MIVFILVQLQFLDYVLDSLLFLLLPLVQIRFIALDCLLFVKVEVLDRRVLNRVLFFHLIVVLNQGLE